MIERVAIIVGGMLMLCGCVIAALEIYQLRCQLRDLQWDVERLHTYAQDDAARIGSCARTQDAHDRELALINQYLRRRIASRGKLYPED